MKGSRPKAEVNMRRAGYWDMLSYYSVSSYGLEMERRRKRRGEEMRKRDSVEGRGESGDIPSYRSACSAILAKNTHSSLSILLYVLHKYYIS